MSTRILIADDHPFFSDGIRNALLPYPEYEVLGALQDGREVPDALKKCRPDVLILDINLPGMTGLELLPLIRKTYPELRIMLLSMYLPSDVQLDIQSPLIDAYVLKNSGTEILLTALREISQGRRYADPSIRKLNGLHSRDSFSQQLKLSSREKDIIELLKQGFTSKEIGEKLFISELTVKTHRKNIMSKLEVRNVAELLQKIR